MRKILLLILFVIICGNISAQKYEKDNKMQCIVLCDHSEKKMTMYIVNEKFCFLSSKNENLITLFNPEQILKITVISPSEKSNFEECIKKYCYKYKTQIDVILNLKLKEGQKLPSSLAKYYKEK